tara:strand:- start:702 stop:1445 length:744 start_codon:yes stop_codon:yes gene_type:complete
MISNILAALAGPALGNVVQTGIGSLLGKEVGTSMLGKLLTGAVGGGITSKLLGRKDKDTLKDALMAGIGSGTLGGTNILGNLIGGSSGEAAKSASSAKAVADAKAASEGIAAANTMSGEVAKMFGLPLDSGIGSLLNSKLGELGMFTLLPYLFGGDEGEERKPRPFGGTDELIPLMPYNLGGVANFPRRDGGISPSEGSGTKDDVPAMLTAGEFVLTKDAVKGLGGGNNEVGIKRAYNMMNKLEGMA